MLRASFVREAGQPKQIVQPTLDLPIAVTDLKETNTGLSRMKKKKIGGIINLAFLILFRD